MIATAPPRRRGTAYLLLLGASALVALIGLSALQAAGARYEAAARADDALQARWNAMSAIDLALRRIELDTGWRTTFGNDKWPAGQPLGGGFWDVLASDPADGNVALGAGDPLLLTGVGTKGGARHRIQVRLEPRPSSTPLEVLRAALCAHGTLHILAGRKLAALGGAVSSNGTVLNEGAIFGDVEAVGPVIGGGVIAGVLSITAAEAMPAASVPDAWAARATVLPYTGPIDGMVLGAGLNEYGGGLNADGIYLIDTGGGDLVIRGSRIKATLVVRCGAGGVILSDAVFLEPARADLPALVVEGDLELRCDSATVALSEAAWNVNFNPPGAAYLGVSDSDRVDIYPNEVRGLVHATGSVLMAGTARVHGTIVGEGALTIDGDVRVVHDPILEVSPPPGYAEPAAGSSMQIVPGTWKQVVD